MQAPLPIHFVIIFTWLSPLLFVSEIRVDVEVIRNMFFYRPGYLYAAVIPGKASIWGRSKNS